jgi:hypothetical protein
MSAFGEPNPSLTAGWNTRASIDPDVHAKCVPL